MEGIPVIRTRERRKPITEYFQTNGIPIRNSTDLKRIFCDYLNLHSLEKIDPKYFRREFRENAEEGE